MNPKRHLIACVIALGTLSVVAFAIQSGKPKLVREPVQEEKPEADTTAAAAPEYNPAKAEKSVGVGKYYFRQGKLEAAIGRFRDALVHKPDYPDAYLWLARSYEKLKKYKEAAAALLEYEQKFPKSHFVESLKKERLRLEQKS